MDIHAAIETSPKALLDKKNELIVPFGITEKLAKVNRGKITLKREPWPCLRSRKAIKARGTKD
jgi:hypothetical protein